MIGCTDEETKKCVQNLGRRTSWKTVMQIEREIKAACPMVNVGTEVFCFLGEKRNVVMVTAVVTKSEQIKRTSCSPKT